MKDTLNYVFRIERISSIIYDFAPRKLDRACREKAFQSRINSLNARNYHL